MTCEACRAAMRAARPGDWPPAIAAHVVTCDACLNAGIDLALRQRPAPVPPPAFAADVARRARVAAAPGPGRSRGFATGILAGMVSAAAPAVWLAASGDSAGLPAAAFILALAEGVALGALTTQTDVVRPRFRLRRS